MMTRRQFSKLIVGSSLLASGDFGEKSGPLAHPAQSANPDYDLLIKGGTVIDPGQNLHAALDVAVKNGKILQLSPDIPAARARSVVSAKGKIVTPGLIDSHVHVFESMGPITVNADLYCLNRGVTTVVDTGSTGYAGIAALQAGQFSKRKKISTAGPVRTRSARATEPPSTSSRTNGASTSPTLTTPDQSVSSCSFCR